MSHVPANEVKLLEDLPSDLENDQLGHRAYAAVLAETLRSNTPPVTIGFFGPWGVGKSSVLSALETELQDDTTDFVLFNAWRYEHNSLRRELLRTVALSIQTSRPNVLGMPTGPSREKLLRRLDVDQQSGIVRLRPTLGSAAVVLTVATIFVAALVSLHTWLPAVVRPFGGGHIDQGQALASMIALASLLVTLVGLLFRPVTVVETRRRIEDPEQFEEVFKKILDRARKKRIVIAIDDLDRCAANEAVALLANVKTFLEPRAAKAAPDVFFIVAADESALLAHWDEPDVGREFLRKLFTASVRIPPLLASDLRGFATQRATLLAAQIGLTPADTLALAGLMENALRTSPRQVIQFLNNLQLTMRLIRERERPPRPLIHGEVSRHPLLVAKLGLIQERWPDRYESLINAPHLLDEWHRAAREGRLELSGGFEAFLLLSDTVESRYLPAVLRLKQSPLEIDLPEWTTFQVAVRSGARDEATKILADAGPEDAARYLEQLAATFDDELRDGYVDGARAVLAVVLDQLSPGDEGARVMLTRAVNDSRLRAQLSSLSLARLLQHVSHLRDEPRRLALDSLLQILTVRNPERARDVLAAFAESKPELSHEQLSTLRSGLTVPSALPSAKDLRRLVDVYPSIVDPHVVQTVLTELRPELVKPPGRSAALSLLKDFASHPASAFLGQISVVDVAARFFDGARDDDFETWLAIVDRVLDTAVDVGDTLSKWMELFDHAPSGGRALLESLWPYLLSHGTEQHWVDLMRRALDRGSPPVDRLVEQAGDLDPTRRSYLFREPLMRASQGPDDASSGPSIALLKRSGHSDEQTAVAEAWTRRGVPFKTIKETWLDPLNLTVSEAAVLQEAILLRIKSSKDRPREAAKWFAAALRADIAVEDPEGQLNAIVSATTDSSEQREAIGILLAALAPMDDAHLDSVVVAVARLAITLIGPTELSAGRAVIDSVIQVAPRLDPNSRADLRQRLWDSWRADGHDASLDQLGRLADMGTGNELDMLAREVVRTETSSPDVEEKEAILFALACAAPAAPQLALRIAALRVSEDMIEKQLESRLRIRDELRRFFVGRPRDTIDVRAREILAALDGKGAIPVPALKVEAESSAGHLSSRLTLLSELGYIVLSADNQSAQLRPLGHRVLTA